VSFLKNNLKNIPGRRIRERFLIIECDDWGSIRMPSLEICDNLIKEGLVIEGDRFNYDTIESSEDMEQLFDILENVRDRNGHHAIMTALTNMANPDFIKIKESGFTEYHYEPFTHTYQNYQRGNEVMDLWQKGIDAGIFIPELHGREHISVQLWLKKLREGNRDLIKAFDSGFVSVALEGVNSVARGFRPEFYFDSWSEVDFLKNSIKDAVSIFREVFNFNPCVFVPGNGVFHPIFEETLASCGVEFLYVNRIMRYRNPDAGEIKKNYFIGQKGTSGLRYYIRNCSFEPSSSNYKGIEHTLSQIAASFKWGKPAIISTHRVNFTGSINANNRSKGLGELNKLLNAILRNWPDVQFISSREGLASYVNH
jgi:hypothetical protein